jgi:RES domain-containing protein
MYRGLLYRALNPVYAREPLSGRGAELYGGRFNAKGTPAIYTSLTIMTALREANQVGTLQPTTLVCYEAEIERIFDTRDVAALAAGGMDGEALADASWRDQIKANGEAKTQTFARRLIDAGYHGLLVRSFARGSGADDMNLVLFSWGAMPPSRLMLIDDEKRLTRPPTSPS